MAKYVPRKVTVDTLAREYEVSRDTIKRAIKRLDS
jgi:DNA-binding GntR family transcriptional regulator